MKKKELGQKDVAALASHRHELKEKLFSLSMNSQREGIKDVAQIKRMKKEIARCNTYIAQQSK